MNFDDSTVGLLLVIALAGAGLLLIAVTVLALQLRRMKSNFASALEGDEDVFATLKRHAKELEGTRADVRTVHDNTELLRELMATATSRTAVVRFDAFEDMGGAMSFSAALLDEAGTGVVLTSINGRAETRTYAKQVVNGTTTGHTLSGEEERAIKEALAGERSRPMAGASRRRRRKSTS